MALLATITLKPRSQTGELITYADVYITLVDTVTGLPANGNNVIVTYQVNTNGVITTQQATIPGQSLLIATHTIINEHDANWNLVYYKNYIIVDISNTPNPAPPVNACDLYITNVNIDKPESASGAADARITIHATSSYLPLQYSLDGVTYQSSNTFANLTGGAKTVYVTDANNIGCTASILITIPVLTRLLVNDPTVNINGNISRWNAAFNPVVFTYQRKDFDILSVSLDSLTNNAKLLINTNVSAVTDGELVYINTDVYKGIYKVSPVTGVSNMLVINTPFIANATGFININSLKPYYKLLIDITYQDTLTGWQTVIQSSNRPDTTGLTKADISNFLQSLVRPKDDSDFTAINFRDDNLSASYRIAYAEHWDDGTDTGKTSDWVQIADTFYVVYAAKQLGQRYGGNLAAYVPFANAQSLARWVTDFAEPAYSANYPFDIGFIYSEDLLGLDLYCQLTLLDINRNPLPGGPLTTFLLNEDSSWLLNQDGSKFIIAKQTITNAPLAHQLGLNRLLVDGSFPDEAYYFTITLKYDDNGNARAVTQTQTVRIDKAGDSQSVYMRWIGLSGSWNYYRFVYNQEVSLDVQNAVIIKNYVADWEHQDAIEDVISKTAGQKMKVMAEDLSVADIKGLQSIKYSPKVQMFTGKDPVKWQTVVINTATFSEYETLNGQAPFSITFNLPGINIQTQ